MTKESEDQLDVYGLIEGGISGSGPGKLTGRRALAKIARRGLVGLRKIKLSEGSDEITVHDTSPVDKRFEYALTAQLVGYFGEQLTAKHLFLAELDSSLQEFADKPNFFQFPAPRAGRIVSVKLVVQNMVALLPSTTVDLHIYSKNPNDFDPDTEERYNVLDVTSIDITEAEYEKNKSMYDAVHVDSYYINDDVGANGIPREMLYCNLVASSGTYNFILRVWILPLCW